jgi:hypothetical protein
MGKQSGTYLNLRMRVSYTLFFVLFSCLVFSKPEVTFSFSIPFSTQEAVGTLIDHCLEELDEIFGYSLSFPIRVVIQRESGFGVRGEASFDGHTYVVFFNPSFTDLPYLVRHELMHLYTFEWVWRIGERNGTSEFTDSFSEMPLWVIEGIAVWYENRTYETPFSAFPWEVVIDTDFLVIDVYPNGEKLYRYYELLSDFFRFYSARVDFKAAIPVIFSFTDTESNWVTRFSTATGKDFLIHYIRWKNGKLWWSWVSFFIETVTYGIPFIILALFAYFFFLKRKRTFEPFDPRYEALYGKEYWNKHEHEKITENGDLQDPKHERQQRPSSTQKRSPR